MAVPPLDLRLAVDVGNTNTVIGLFDGKRIVRHWRLPTRKDATVDEIALWLRGLLRPEAELAGIRASAMASVVPMLDESWAQALEDVLGAAPEILDWSNCLGLRLEYEIPRQIGADRLANVLGAHALGHKQGVVIDLGTATTYDVFGPDCYFGGIICPGIQSSLRGLAQTASKLSEVELKWIDKAVGTTTDDALRIGMLQGTVGQVEYLLKAIFADKKMRSPSVIATGGLAPLLGGRSRAIHVIEPDLTLIGINHLIDGRSKKRKRKK
ncbi:MAG: type III pantothenate kinase [Fibrobacteres bacterium]|jgi:type III pantothenate kinase|nr:type III pantothenate kinase [Fibrobacterota bacterium]